MKSQTSLQLLEHLQAQGITSDKFAQIEQRLSTELKRRKEIKKLEGSLFEFVKAAWPSIDSAPFQSNWAIEALCLHLEAVANGDIKRLLVNFPPRASKTSVVSICFPAWVWARTERSHTSGPGVQFLCSSYNHDLSLQNSNKTRRLILSPWYQERWGKRYTFREDQNTKTQFDTSEGGSRIATSVGGSLLGIGGSILLADDLHNTETVESEAERETVTNYWKEFSSTRLNDPQQSAIVVVMQRLHQCLLPGTIVRTPAGSDPIETISVGDEVYGSEGWTKVTHAGARNYHGTAYGVRTYGNSVVSWTSDNHLYFTKRGWVRADQLIKTDWVCFPINGKNNLQTPWEEPRWTPIPTKATGSFTGTRGAKKKCTEQIPALALAGLTDTEIGRRLGIHRNTVHAYRFHYKIRRMLDRNPIFGRAHLDDPDFWRFVGYWVAEGSFMWGRNGAKCGVRLTFGSHEPHLVEFCKTVMKRYGVDIQENFKPSAHEAQICCSQLARWLQKYFGEGAHNKKIPEFVYGLSNSLKRELLEGWLIGDGCYRKESGQRSGGSVSVALVQGFQRLALSLGINVHLVTNRSNQRISFINGKAVTTRGNSQEMRYAIPNVKRSKSQLDGDRCWYRIYSISTKRYDGKLYDITTGSHDFVVGNALVHNSDVSGIIIDDEHDYKNWTHLMIPMHHDLKRHCETVLKYDDEGEPLITWEDPRTEEGELMWPERFDEVSVASIEHSLGPYMASGRLEQSPNPKGGGIIQREWWNLWPPEGEKFDAAGKPLVKLEYPEMDFMMAYVDTALTTKEENDWSALTIWGVFTDSSALPKAILIDAWHERLEFSQLVAKIMETCKLRKVDALLIESKANGISVAQEIRRLTSGNKYMVKLDDPKGDKVARAYSVQHLFAPAPDLLEAWKKDQASDTPRGLKKPKGMIYAPDRKWADMVISECENFPKGVHDDLVDTVVGALRYLRASSMLETREEVTDNLNKRFAPTGEVERLYPSL